MIVVQIAFVTLLSYALVSDVRSLIIPNWISLALLVLFAVYAVIAPPSTSIFWHAAVALAVLGGGFVLYLFGWMGAGDIKLLTAVSLWAGPASILDFLLFTSVLGVALALLIRATQIYVLPSAWSARLADHIPDWVRHGLCPYGIAIVIGAFMTMSDFF